MVCKGEEKLTTIEKKNADVKFKVANVIISIWVVLLLPSVPVRLLLSYCCNCSSFLEKEVLWRKSLPLLAPEPNGKVKRPKST